MENRKARLIDFNAAIFDVEVSFKDFPPQTVEYKGGLYVLNASVYLNRNVIVYYEVAKPVVIG